MLLLFLPTRHEGRGSNHTSKACRPFFLKAAFFLKIAAGRRKSGGRAMNLQPNKQTGLYVLILDVRKQGSIM
jgi:hypothetical protein